MKVLSEEYNIDIDTCLKAADEAAERGLGENPEFMWISNDAIKYETVKDYINARTKVKNKEELK